MEESKIMAALEEVKAYTLLAAKEMLTVEEVALFTGYKDSYIVKMTQEGRLPYYKPFGKKIFFKKSEINELLQGQRVPSVAELIEKIN